MDIRGHDARYSFDNVAWVNAVFAKLVDQHLMKQFCEYQFGISPAVMAKFFRYENVSLPTMLQIEYGSGVPMRNYVISID